MLNLKIHFLGLKAKNARFCIVWFYYNQKN